MQFLSASSNFSKRNFTRGSSKSSIAAQQQQQQRNTHYSSAAMEGDGFGNATAQLDKKKKKMTQGFQRSFVQVESILDQNRLLIYEISQNQESKVPAGLTRNVGLIRDLNNNFQRVLNLYADLSADSSEGGSTGPKPEGPA